MKHLLRFILVIYLIVSVLTYFFTCMSPFIHPRHSGILYFSGLGFPLIFINFTLLSIVFSFWKRKFLALFTIIPGIIYSLNFISLNNPGKTEVDDVVIYSLNARSGSLFNEKVGELDRWQDYMKADTNKADIICLQEYYKDLNTLFPDHADLFTFTKPKSNLKIVSRYPIISGGELKDESSLRFAIYADIKLNNDTIRVYNFHLRSNFISDWLKQPVDEDKTSADRMLESGDKLRKSIYESATRRADEAKKLRWHMEACPYDLIVCGDMNETAQSYSYFQIKGDLEDTFRKGSPGVHPTFAKQPNWVRIDYIFVESDFDVLSYRVLPFEISDHRLVRVSVLK